jgi:endonuclease-3
MKKNNFISKKKTEEVLEILDKTYPDAHCELNFRTPFQLLVATMLSAQSTDKTVNKVTDKLFVKYPDLEEFLALDQGQLEHEIKEIGLYKNKSKNIKQMCNILEEKFQGRVPDNMEDLVSLPGVGRKTANVVLSNAFGVPAIAVDTHVFRVSNRIGMADGKNVDITEEQLRKNIPMDKWSKAHHLLIWHGRRICFARKPKCEACPIAVNCRYYKKEVENLKK